MATNYRDATWVAGASPGINAAQLNRIDGGVEAFHTEWQDNMVGALLMYIASTAPSAKWLICDGATVSKATYAALWTLIGHTYATDPGGGNFTLPDFRGRLPIGLTPATTALNALGKTAGGWDHRHTQSNHRHAGGDHTHSIPATDSGGAAHTHTNTATGSDGTHGHTLSGSVTSAGSHSHSVLDTNPGQGTSADRFDTSSSVVSLAQRQHEHSMNDTETAGAHTHAHSFSVSDASGHTHTTSDTGSHTASHTHNISAETGAGSAGSATDGGGDDTDTGNPPVLVVNFLIRALA